MIYFILIASSANFIIFNIASVIHSFNLLKLIDYWFEKRSTLLLNIKIEFSLYLSLLMYIGVCVSLWRCVYIYVLFLCYK